MILISTTNLSTELEHPLFGSSASLHSPSSVAFNAGHWIHTSDLLFNVPSSTLSPLCFGLNFVASEKPSASRGAPLQYPPPPLPLEDTNLP